MPVQDIHPEYSRYLSQWKACRDTANGQYAVHKAGTEYLPKLSGQDEFEYDAYKGRALFYEATGRTIQGLTGMIFRKPPIIDEGGQSDFLNDVDLMGTSIKGFAENITEQVMTVGRIGVLIEYPQSNTDGMTRAQVDQLNMRPYFHKYKTEAIRNWKIERINNKAMLSQVRLHEIVDESVNEFETNEVEQLRVLDLDEGRYRVRLYRKVKDKWVEYQEPVYPMRNGSFMNEIPFVVFSADGLGFDVKKPPLMGLVNINLSHYKTTADLEHGAHFTGLPTAIITGYTSEDGAGEYRIGSSTAWAFSNDKADAKYLEFTGQGLGSLVERLKAKEQMMASLGAQMLVPEARRNESTETAGMRHMGENSILSNISQTISEGINKCLEFAAEWMGVNPADIELNRDFMPTPMTPQMMKELVASWQMGAISSMTLFENLKDGEVIRSDKEFDEEQDEIQNGALTLPNVGE